MDQLVFVHGVNTRKDAGYGLAVENRDRLFKETAWAGAPVNIRNVYWGDLAAQFGYDLACLPSKGPKSASFGLLGGIATPGAVVQAQPLSSLASTDFGAMVDAIFVAMIEESEAAGKPLTGDQIAKFRAAGEYAVNNAAVTPSWATGATSDQVIVSELGKRVAPSAAASFGLGDDIAKAAKALADRARNLVSSGIAPIIRDEASPLVARFLGDIFVYLSDRGTPSKRAKIREIIAADVNAAAVEAGKKNGKLVLIGHSLGGVILLDMLGDPSSGIDQNIKIDLLATVGSQPGLFQEMSLLGNATKAPQRVPLVPSIGSWWNVYDPVDLLSFRCAPMFQDVQDFEFSSATGLVDAHTSYFKRPRFYARLHERIKQIGMGA
ncbi:hypothetical protein [Bradyrhizobium brasilense]|uniref:hypothetical protein n=1 Tax=Bradyrhizobium brasilense TaxID=1419277 RepID=UPI001E2A8D61|nr:hypothetical protein [Bradyrhizobium brasilense]MCC8969763.1 hypothetical protein [Bradyrhizobium brasilense]